MDPAMESRVLAAAEALRRGGVVVYPTETFYGLGALARDAAAVARLARAKGRPEGKPLPLLAADLAMVEDVAVLGPGALRVASLCWPGPVTIVLPARQGLPPAISAGSGTVGIRVPGSEIARALSRAAGGAIVSTSANASGAPPPARPQDLDPRLLERVDHVLDAGAAPGGLPSTVVAFEGDVLRLVRPGAVPFDALLRRLAPGGALI